MKIGIIRETKVPEDNRVALAPEQVKMLSGKYPNDKIVVQSSEIRAFTDEEYRKEGVEVVSNIDDCDVLFGIKEAKIETLIPNKHYFFFGHIAKFQEYNKSLCKALLTKKIKFCDYEYLVDENEQRVCAFGWWAGVVGVYYTLRGYGIRENLFELPKPDRRFTLEQLLKNLQSIKLPAIKLLVTGRGRVSQGAQYVLDNIGVEKISNEEYLNTKIVAKCSYTVATTESLVKRKDLEAFNNSDFKLHPELYESDFEKWYKTTDVLISCHFWDSKAPVYLSKQNLKDPNIKIRMIGDVTCDICGSIESTLRASTHDKPYYDYNVETEQEELAFSNKRNITVMAVDTCPNALAIDTSRYFGEMLIEHVFVPLLNGEKSNVINCSTIMTNGKYTSKFSYLKSFVKDEL